ncbi:MAG: glycosyltransferase [Opitutales bacterium]|jgi:thiamine biosynthesis lipoprotein ApbE|nr:glycosyltransferase [Opitutales bacterium]
MNNHANNPSVQSYTHEAMACEFTFHLLGERSSLMDSAVAEAEELLANIEDRLSLYVENSDTCRINRAKVGETVLVSEETVSCLLQAFDASARLDGKFHPFMGLAALTSKKQEEAVGRFLNLHNESPFSQEPVIAMDPESNAIQKLREGPLLDLGGIGKGYALDRLAALFREWNFNQGLLESAGSTFVAMDVPEGESGWDLEVGYGSSTRFVSLTPGNALASSGELFQGTHVIDPHSNSIENLWKRSYAFAENGALADAASTAALLLGSDSLTAISQINEPLSFALHAKAETFSSGEFFAQDDDADRLARILLVVPCYKESKRLPVFLPELCQAIGESELPVIIQVVDDGSPGDEPETLKSIVTGLREKFSFLNKPLLLKGNLGKGGAIRAGWDSGNGFGHLAFVDADGAVPAAEVVRVLNGAEAETVYLAVRDSENTPNLERALSRKIVARIFNWLIRIRYAIRISDTQCGFKIIPESFYLSVREQLVQRGYAFDLELILLAKKSGCSIKTVPVEWTEMPGGTTNLKDGLTFLKQLIKHSI